MTREDVYDEQIAPLMSEIIRVCKAHDIACFASFRIDDDGTAHDDDHSYCTTKIPSTLGAAPLDRAFRALRGPSPLVAFTITSEPKR